MTISLLYGCCQIETCASDLGAARTFLTNALQGVPAEQTLARQICDLIPGDAYEVDHIDCGGAIFQINRPSAQMQYDGTPSVHQCYLEAQGPCVTNLNYFVDDVSHARTLLTSMGSPTFIEGPSNAVPALGDYGFGNTRADANQRPFLFMGTRPLIGLDLEIMEPNFLRFMDQSVQLPAYIEPRPSQGSGVLLHRLLIAVPDLRVLLDNLASIFTPASRSKPYGLRQGKSGRALRLGLGGIELEFCQPQAPGCELLQMLAKRGPGVFAIAFGVQDIPAILRRSAAAGYPAQQNALDHIGTSALPDTWLIPSRSTIGFDTIIEPLEMPLPITRAELMGEAFR